MKNPANKKFRSDVQKGLFRVPVTITKEMENWLHKLSNEMKGSGGYKLPKTYIVRSLLSAAMKLDINVNGVKDEKELEKRIKDAIKKSRG